MTSRLDEIKNALAAYEAAIAECRGSDELAAVDSVFMSSVHTDDLRDLLAVCEAAVGFVENTTPVGNIEPGEKWLYKWDDEAKQLRCLGCGSPLGKPHAENEKIPCYGRLLDEAVAKLTADSGEA